jgi:hypothetical protein
MESAVRESDYVLLVCTPGFAQRANARKGGVGYEQTVVTGEILSGIGHPEKFIPILRGPEGTSVPSFLRSRVWVDFSDDSQFEGRVVELLEALGERPSVAPARSGDSDDDEETGIDEDLRVYQEAMEFARAKTGLAMTKTMAEEFAAESQETMTLEGFRLVVDAFGFAREEMKLSRVDAEDFARAWLDREDPAEFDTYQELFRLATASDGMNLRASDAREFVADFDSEHGLNRAYRFEQAYRVARGTGKSYGESEQFAFEKL